MQIANNSYLMGLVRIQVVILGHASMYLILVNIMLVIGTTFGLKPLQMLIETLVVTYGSD